jgi:hypothetical protein
MAYETINLGTLPNDGRGDPLRVAFTKINNNFTSVSNLTANTGVNGSLQFISISNVGNTQVKTFVGSGNLVFDTVTNSLKIGATIVPTVANTVDIGSIAKPFGNIYGNVLHLGNTVIGSANGTLDLSGSNVVFGNSLSYGTMVTVTNFTLQAITTTTLTNQPIYQLPLTDFTSATVEIESRSQSTQDTQKVTLSIVRKNDASNLSYTAHGTVFLGNTVTTYDVIASSGNAIIQVSPLIAGTITHNINVSTSR